MNYTVKYKLSTSWFWKTIKNVRGDTLAQDIPHTRVIILDNEERIEIPMIGTLFWFSSARFISIKKQMEKETGLPLAMR